MIHLDTHVVAWLYAGQMGRFPEAVRAKLEAEALVISPMVRLELQYLMEIGRLTVGGQAICDDLHHRIGLRFAPESFEEVTHAALGLTWTRDPFDRLIAAHALVAGAPLMTRDATILAEVPRAQWG